MCVFLHTKKLKNKKININNQIIKMSDDLLLPIYKRSIDSIISIPTNSINKCKLMEVIIFHITFIIGDIYFSIFNCNSPDVIINITGYFTLYASIELIWSIYVIKLIINKENIVLSCNCDSYAFMIYHLFVLLWNLIIFLFTIFVILAWNSLNFIIFMILKWNAKTFMIFIFL